MRIETIPVEMKWDEEAGQWVTYVPLLNNIATFGRTQAEALRNTREMMLAYVESMSADGLPLPLTKGERKSLIGALKSLTLAVAHDPVS